MIQNKIVKPIELVLFSENDTDINGDFRDPLEIFVKRFDDSEKEPYICRKISRDDGLIYFLNKKPSKIEEIDAMHKVVRKLRMLICITMFDEPEERLTSTLESIYDNLKSFCSNDISPDDIAVVVLADGIRFLSPSMLAYFKELDKEIGSSSLTIESRLTRTNEEIAKYVGEAKSEVEKMKRTEETSNTSYFPGSIPKKTSICYQTRKTAKDFPHTTLIGSRYENIKMNIFYNVKMTNNGKLSSHMWFFQGFCKLFNPEYCTILECGTRPSQKGLFNFFRALESDKNLGGVCGYLGGKDYSLTVVKTKQLPFKFDYDPTDNVIMKFIPVSMNYIMLFLNFMISLIESIFSLQKAQQFEHSWDNIYEKSYQSLFGFLPVLPSAWSAYRWDALAEDNLLEKEYLVPIKNPDYVYKSIKEANKILTEDRLLSLAIFTKRNKMYYLKYVPDAVATVDLIETVPDFLTQRKRLINGGWYAIEHMIYYNNQIRFSKHSNSSKLAFSFVIFMSKIDMAVLYLLPCFYYVCLKIVMFEYMQNISLVANPATSLAGFWLFYFISLMVTLIFISIQFKSIDKDMVFFFRILSHFMGIFMLFTLTILIILIVREIFMGTHVYFINPLFIQSLFIVILGCLLLTFICNPSAWKDLISGGIHYLYYLPTFTHISTVYAFCRIDDLSWGIKGAHSNMPASRVKEFKDFKVEFVASWMIVNTVLSYIVIVVISKDEYQGGFLTMLLCLIALFVGLKTLFSFIYSMKFCLFDQKEHHEKMKEMNPYYKKDKEEIERYYENLKVGFIVTENPSADNSQNIRVPTDPADLRMEYSTLLGGVSPQKLNNPFGMFGQKRQSTQI